MSHQELERRNPPKPLFTWLTLSNLILSLKMIIIVIINQFEVNSNNQFYNPIKILVKILSINTVQCDIVYQYPMF